MERVQQQQVEGQVQQELSSCGAQCWVKAHAPCLQEEKCVTIVAFCDMP